MLSSDILMLISAVLLGAATVLYLWRVFAESGALDRFASPTALAACAVLGVGLVMRGIELGAAPFCNLPGALAFTAWVLVAIFLYVERRRQVAALGIFVSVVGLKAVVAGLVLPGSVNAGLTPVLANPWSVVHIGTSLVGYASLLLAFGAAIGYAIQEYLLKNKRITRLQRHLPALDVMDALSYRMVAFGFLLLTVGVISGVLWAQTAWHKIWDPKLTWALITWLVYAAYLHMRVVRGWRGKWSNRLLIIGFACILVTFLGVSFLSTGLHRYNW